MVSDQGLILAFDTSAAQCAAALLWGDRCSARRIEPMVRGQAERLLPMLEELLFEAGIGWRDLGASRSASGRVTSPACGVARGRGTRAGAGARGAGGRGRPASRRCRAARSGAVTLEDRRSAALRRSSCATARPRGRSRGRSGARPVPGGDPVARAPRQRDRRPAGPPRRVRGNRCRPGGDRPDRGGRLGSAPPPAPLYLRPADATPRSRRPCAR